MCAPVFGVEGLPDAEARANRGEGEGYDGDVLCTGQGNPTARRYPQAQEHLSQPRRRRLRSGSGASQADQKAGVAENLDRRDRPENSSCRQRDHRSMQKISIPIAHDHSPKRS